MCTSSARYPFLHWDFLHHINRLRHHRFDLFHFRRGAHCCCTCPPWLFNWRLFQAAPLARAADLPGPCFPRCDCSEDRLHRACSSARHQSSFLDFGTRDTSCVLEDPASLLIHRLERNCAIKTFRWGSAETCWSRPALELDARGICFSQFPPRRK